MPPVRVKVYGLLNLTRRTYLTFQTLGLLAALAAIGVGLWWPRPQLPAGGPTPRQQLFLWLLDSLPWLAGLVLVIEAVETYLVLHQFARKQAQADQAARLASGESMPNPPLSP